MTPPAVVDVLDAEAAAIDVRVARSRMRTAVADLERGREHPAIVEARIAVYEDAVERWRRAQEGSAP